MKILKITADENNVTLYSDGDGAVTASDARFALRIAGMADFSCIYATNSGTVKPCAS